MSRRIAPAAALFVLAPVVAEFLLGNLPVTMLAALVTLAPLYGGGALLIRELARRRGAGWPGVMLLGLAFGLLQEAFVTRTLTDRGYAGLGLLEIGYVPFLGIGAWWTVFVVVLHAVWSIAVPIALVESLTAPGRHDSPWLAAPGLVAAAALTLLGGVGASVFAEVGEAPTTAQAVGVLVVAVVLVVAALARPAGGALRRPSSGPDRRAPRPAWVALLSLAAGSLFWAMAATLDDVVRVLGESGTVAAYLLLCAATGAGVNRLAWRTGWGRGHVLALAAGAVLTYVWHSFLQPPAVPVDPAVDLAGSLVLAVGAVVLVVVAARRVGALTPSRRSVAR